MTAEQRQLVPVEAPAKRAMADDDEFERFLYLVTHDLRACFRALRTIPEWIREDLSGTTAPTDVHTHLDMLITQARRGDRMLLDLREFSRVGRLCGPIMVEPVRSIAERCWGNIGVPDEMSLDLSLAEGSVALPRDDATRLFSAILDNAVKHRAGDAGRVSVRCAEEGKKWLSIRIEDDGPGIEPQFRDKAFGLLTTLRPRDACEGSGVGLAIARRIVETAGGQIGLGDGPGGKGLSVGMTLPRMPVAVD